MNVNINNVNKDCTVLKIEKQIWKLPVLKIEQKSECLARFVKRIKPRCGK
jgi:hypothetical protein